MVKKEQCVNKKIKSESTGNVSELKINSSYTLKGVK